MSLSAGLSVISGIPCKMNEVIVGFLCCNVVGLIRTSHAICSSAKTLLTPVIVLNILM